MNDRSSKNSSTVDAYYDRDLKERTAVDFGTVTEYYTGARVDFSTMGSFGVRGGLITSIKGSVGSGEQITSSKVKVEAISPALSFSGAVDPASGTVSIGASRPVGPGSVSGTIDSLIAPVAGLRRLRAPDHTLAFIDSTRSAALVGSTCEPSLRIVSGG